MMEEEGMDVAGSAKEKVCIGKGCTSVLGLSSMRISLFLPLILYNFGSST